MSAAIAAEMTVEDARLYSGWLLEAAAAELDARIAPHLQAAYDELEEIRSER